MRGVVVGHGDEPRRAYIRPEPGQGARDRAGGRLQQARQLFIGENSTTAERQLAKANAVEEPDWEADTGRVTSRVPGAQVATRFGRPVENDPDQQRVLTDPGRPLEALFHAATTVRRWPAQPRQQRVARVRSRRTLLHPLTKRCRALRPAVHRHWPQGYRRVRPLQVLVESGRADRDVYTPREVSDPLAALIRRPRNPGPPESRVSAAQIACEVVPNRRPAPCGDTHRTSYALPRSASK